MENSIEVEAYPGTAYIFKEPSQYFYIDGKFDKDEFTQVYVINALIKYTKNYGGYSNEDILPNIVIPEKEGYYFTYIETKEDEQNGYTEYDSTYYAFKDVKDVRFEAEVVVYLDEVKSVEFYNYFVDFVESLDDVKFFIVIKENDSFRPYGFDQKEFKFSGCNDYLFSYR